MGAATAYWLNISLLNAFYAKLGILLVFFIYVTTFTLTFDKVFGLPESAIYKIELS